MSSWTLQPPAFWPWLVIALPVALGFSLWWSRRHQRELRADFGERAASLLGEPSWRIARGACTGLAVLLVGIALLRPVAPGRAAQLAPDVVLCVDVSRSMAAGDAAPSRFEALQQQVHRLLAGALGSRFALLAFTGDVQPLAPLTADREAIAWLLDELLPGAVLPTGGTDLGAAIEAAVQRLERVEAVGDIVLLTDGEDFAGNGARAARLAFERGHRVHCVGFGSAAGSKIVVERDGDESFLQDGTGQDVITRLDLASLRAVAAAGDGTFVQARAAADLLDLWRDNLLPHATSTRLASGQVEGLPRFGWPLFAGLLLLMLSQCLPERRR